MNAKRGRHLTPCDYPDDYGSRCWHRRFCQLSGHHCAAYNAFIDSLNDPSPRAMVRRILPLRPASIHMRTNPQRPTGS